MATDPAKFENFPADPSFSEPEAEIFQGEEETEAFDFVHDLIRGLESGQGVMIRKVPLESSFPISGQSQSTKTNPSRKLPGEAEEGWTATLKAGGHETGRGATNPLQSSKEKTEMSDAPEDTPKWVEERAARMEERMNTTEERVGRWTDEASSKIEKIGTRLESKIDRVQREQQRIRNDNKSLRSNLLNGASIAAVIVVGLFTAILSRIGSVQELVIRNTRRVAELGSPAGADTSVAANTAASGSAGWLLPSLVLVIIGLALVVGALWAQTRSEPSASEEKPPDESSGSAN